MWAHPTSDNLASWNGGSYSNVFVSAKVQVSALNGSLTVAGRLGSYSGGIPAAGYAAELLSNGQVKLWRLSDWAQLGSTYTISGLQAGQWVKFGLRLNGSSLSVEIDGVTRITATDSTFTTGEVGLWSYQPTAPTSTSSMTSWCKTLDKGIPLAARCGRRRIAWRSYDVEMGN